MGTRISFSKYENDLLREFRRKLGAAENSGDVNRIFDQSMRALFAQILEDDPILRVADFTLKANEDPLFQIHERLLGTEAFKAAWQNSDLPNIVERFALSAANRAAHIEKNNRKTNLKIRR